MKLALVGSWAGREVGKPQISRLKYGQQVGAAVRDAVRKGVLGGDGGKEGLLEIDRLTVKGVGRVVAHEVDRLIVVVRILRAWRGGGERRVGPGDHTAVHVRVRQQPVVEQVHQLDAAVRTDLQDLSLEDLHLHAGEDEGVRDRVAEGAHAAALLKIVPERVFADAIAGLREGSSVRLGCFAGGRFDDLRCRRRRGGRHRRRGLTASRLTQRMASATTAPSALSDRATPCL